MDIILALINYHSQTSGRNWCDLKSINGLGRRVPDKDGVDMPERVVMLPGNVEQRISDIS